MFTVLEIKSEIFFRYTHKCIEKSDIVLNLQLMMLNKRQLDPLICFGIQSPAVSCRPRKMQLYFQKEMD